MNNNKEKRKNDQREDIKIDDHIGSGSSGTSHKSPNKAPKAKDNILLIMSLVLLAVLTIMAVIQAHYGAIITLGIITGVLTFKLYKQIK